MAVMTANLVFQQNPAAPHRCPSCDKETDTGLSSNLGIVTCCRCATRFTKRPFLKAVLPDKGVTCQYHGPQREETLLALLIVLESLNASILQMGQSMIAHGWRRLDLPNRDSAEEHKAAIRHAIEDLMTYHYAYEHGLTERDFNESAVQYIARRLIEQGWFVP